MARWVRCVRVTHFSASLLIQSVVEQGIWWPAVCVIVVSNAAQIGFTYLFLNGTGNVRERCCSLVIGTGVWPDVNCPLAWVSVGSGRAWVLLGRPWASRCNGGCP
jgi:hypothetical protein